MVLIWDASFTGAEVWTGRFIQWGAWDYPCSYNTNGLTLMSAFDRHGKYMTKMIVNPSTTCFGVNDVSTQGVSLQDGDSMPKEKEGTDNYYGWSFYLPTDFTVSSGESKNIATWAQQYSGLWSAIRLPIEDEYLKISICAGDVTGEVSGCPDNRWRGRVLLTPSQLTRGEWHDVILHIKFSSTIAGIIEFWHKKGSESNYTKVLSETGLPTLQSQNGVSKEMGFRAIGISRRPAASYTDTIYFMAYKVGTTFDDVKYSEHILPVMIEYKNIQGTIEAIGAPVSAPFTVIMRTTPASVSSTDWSILLRKAGSWAIETSPGVSKFGELKSGKLTFEISDIQDLYSTIDMRPLIDQEIHIAIVFEAQHCKFYLNGNLISDVFHIDQPKTNAIIYSGYPYLGFTEYARIWNYALTQTEIQADMNGTIECPVLTCNITSNP